MSEPFKIPFNRTRLFGRETINLEEVLHSDHWHGDGNFCADCNGQIMKMLDNPPYVSVTASCTAALEIACLSELHPGDEVILPSWGFASSANAIVRAGGVPVFVDVQPGTLNIDPNLARKAVTERTRAIMATHYAGVCADMIELLEIHPVLIEDAAQAFLSTYKDAYAGTVGAFGAISFHGTKNVTCGEGGALISKKGWRAEDFNNRRCKSTNIVQARLDNLPFYGWEAIGSSFQMSEIHAAILLAQLEHAKNETFYRQSIWQMYHKGLEPLTSDVALRQAVPSYCGTNGHIYFLLCASSRVRAQLQTFLAAQGIQTSRHYPALHRSTASIALQARGHYTYHANTMRAVETLIRLPMHVNEMACQTVIDAILAFKPE